MAKIDKEYHNLLDKILQEGYKYEDPNRKGVNRLEIPSYTFRHEFKDGFPAISTKKLQYKQVVTELIWFLRGDTNIKYLVDNGCNIWNKDAYNYYLKSHPDYKRDYNFWLERVPRGIAKIGDLGPVYGKQWRDFNGIDQIKDLIQGLKNKPLGTEHIVNSWNVSDLKNMALPPCHYGFQIVVRPLEFDYVSDYTGLDEDVWFDRACKNLQHLDIIKCGDKYFQIFFGPEYDSYEEFVPKYGFELHWSQRSVDTFLGLPYNIASYATLALILEKITGYKALGIQGDLKKVHLYDNSIDAVNEQLSRDPNKYNKCELGMLWNNNPEHINKSNELLNMYNNKGLDFILNILDHTNFKLERYESYPAINVEMLERDE